MVFTLAAAATASLTGFVAGLPFLAVDPPAATTVLILAGAAVLLDAAALWRGRPQPLSVRTQVPVAWSRLFEPPVVALLYGARLGVGPLTILPTWLWWAAFLLGARHGPLPSALVGVAFSAARTLTVLGLGLWVRAEAPTRMARLRAWERATAGALLLLTTAWAIGASTG